MLIKQITLNNGFETNAFFYIDEKNKHGFLIDPGAEAEKLLKIAEENEWVIEKILLTHGHIDHIGAVQQISEALHIPYLIHKNGEEYLKNPEYNLSSFFGEVMFLENATYFDDGEKIALETDPEVFLEVIHTPGHTQDSVVFYDKTEKVAFTGDTIFKGNRGRTNFPGGNLPQLRESIYNKIFTLPEDVVLYSGHTEKTTVKNEKDFPVI